MTALSIAAANNNALAVEALLQHGADPTIFTCEGLSCMDIALNNRFHDVCMVIAKSEKYVNVQKLILIYRAVRKRLNIAAKLKG